MHPHRSAGAVCSSRATPSLGERCVVGLVPEIRCAATALKLTEQLVLSSYSTCSFLHVCRPEQQGLARVPGVMTLLVLHLFWYGLAASPTTMVWLQPYRFRRPWAASSPSDLDARKVSWVSASGKRCFLELNGHCVAVLALRPLEPGVCQLRDFTGRFLPRDGRTGLRLFTKSGVKRR